MDFQETSGEAGRRAVLHRIGLLQNIHSNQMTCKDVFHLIRNIAVEMVREVKPGKSVPIGLFSIAKDVAKNGEWNRKWDWDEIQGAECFEEFGIFSQVTCPAEGVSIDTDISKPYLGLQYSVSTPDYTYGAILE